MHEMLLLYLPNYKSNAVPSLFFYVLKNKQHDFLRESVQFQSISTHWCLRCQCVVISFHISLCWASSCLCFLCSMFPLYNNPVFAAFSLKKISISNYLSQRLQSSHVINTIRLTVLPHLDVGCHPTWRDYHLALYDQSFYMF